MINDKIYFDSINFNRLGRKCLSSKIESWVFFYLTFLSYHNVLTLVYLKIESWAFFYLSFLSYHNSLS